MKEQKCQMQRQVQEKTELLAYAGVSERKSAEQLASANASKKQLLNIINHEIRTPLNGILGMVALLEETILTQEQKDYNGTIKNCSETLMTTVNDVLLSDVLASAKVNFSNPEQKNFDLRNSIEEVFEVFASQTARANLELVYHVDHHVPSWLIGDSLRIRQVLMNLVENAITFTREGEIFVKVHSVAEDAGALELEFEIHDNGLGMPNDMMKHIAQHHLPTEDVGQTNNGLLISKRIITLMGGTLRIESVKGKGTIAKFNLRVQRSDHASQLDHDMSSVHGKRVLVVEDNLTLRTSIVSEMKQWNLNPVEVSSGAEALEMIARGTTFDAVLVEMQMPEMDGMMLSESIRTDNPLLPIILMTVVSDAESKRHPELYHSVLTKPIRYHLLSQHILRCLAPAAEPELLQSTSQKLFSEFAKKNPLRILIAEDNKVNQKLAMKVLTKLGYDPDIVQNGNEVLEEVSNVKYDLILMDIQMPEMDGLEATRMVRLCLTAQPIIIAMTANAMPGDREECLQAGMDDYISKPVHLEELVIMLEKWAARINEKTLIP
ncbi:MAG TPA: response regulator [Chryseolinea sp.]|nr:response regulator [Chryseolinea sp.]